MWSAQQQRFSGDAMVARGAAMADPEMEETRGASVFRSLLRITEAIAFQEETQ
jgi:hypothetical protein